MFKAIQNIKLLHCCLIKSAIHKLHQIMLTSLVGVQCAYDEDNAHRAQHVNRGSRNTKNCWNKERWYNSHTNVHKNKAHQLDFGEKRIYRFTKPYNKRLELKIFFRVFRWLFGVCVLLCICHFHFLLLFLLYFSFFSK